VSHGNLLVLQGVDQGSRFELAEQRIRIGRGAQNDIRILDTEVSRRHATLTWSERGYVLTDENSSNGTFLNGSPVRSQPIRNGDQVQLGRTVLLYTATPSAAFRIGEHVDLVPRDDAGDRSQIIGELDRSTGDELVKRASGGWKTGEKDSPLQVLYRISEEAVRPSASIDEVLQHILDVTLEAVGADRGCMLVADSRTDRIEPRVVSHRAGVDVAARMPVSTSIVEYVINHGQGVRTSDARHDARFEPGQSIVQAGIREALCVPMHGRYELLGVIYVDTTTPAAELVGQDPAPSRFNDDALSLLLAIGRQSALAVENNRYQQALVTAERLAAVGQTIATLSHHIKNILQGVRGGSYLIDTGLNGGDTDLVRKGWHIVERNQDRIYHLVMDMLTYSKDRRPELRPAQVNDTVAEVCELMQGRAAEHAILLETHLSGDLPRSLFDPEAIHRAVLNIVTNAFDVLEDAGDGGKVTVRTGFEPQEEQLFIEVVDNGPGIPEDDLPRLFNLFESSKGARGTGLGLAVSRKILREHGGDIIVESHTGQGCRFRLSWPLLDEARIRADSAEMDALA
jgi:signal transduction histidine kinase